MRLLSIDLLFVSVSASTDRPERPTLCLRLSIALPAVSERRGTQPSAKTRSVIDVLLAGEPLSRLPVHPP